MEEALLQLCQNLQAELADKQHSGGFRKVEVGVGHLHSFLSGLFWHPGICCDFLVSISAEHIPKPVESIRLHYHLEGIRNSSKIHVHCSRPIPEGGGMPEFPTVSNLWHTASWHEREAAELFGLVFSGHPDSRNLLLPADWKGYPLRKNYQPEEKYHGLNIRYERDSRN
jgi:NADH-quinone oxidoreductase subunit C